MAIDRGTRITGERGGESVRLRSDTEPLEAVVPLEVDEPAKQQPAWARYVAGVVAELEPREGFVGEVTTDLPVGSGLSSSAALEVSVALALGFQGSALELAQLCQRAEQRASGVPCGIMDHLCSAAGVSDSALLIDCETLQVEPVAWPDDLAVWVVHSGVERALAGSAYAARRAQCEAAAKKLGPQTRTQTRLQHVNSNFNKLKISPSSHHCAVYCEVDNFAKRELKLCYGT